AQQTDASAGGDLSASVALDGLVALTFDGNGRQGDDFIGLGSRTALCLCRRGYQSQCAGSQTQHQRHLYGTEGAIQGKAGTAEIAAFTYRGRKRPFMAWCMHASVL